MLIEQTLGNVLTRAAAEPIDWLDLSWSDCLQRAVRRQTRGGVMVRVLLPLGESLKHGDILIHGIPGESETIAVNVLPCPVLVATPRTPRQWAELCYELGNLHAPVQIDSDRLITLCDGPVEAALHRLEIPVSMQTLRFEPFVSTTGQVAISDAFALNRRAATGQ